MQELAVQKLQQVTQAGKQISGGIAQVAGADSPPYGWGIGHPWLGLEPPDGLGPSPGRRLVSAVCRVLLPVS